MTRRLFYIALGATVGVLVVRKLSATADRYSPSGLSRGLTGAITDLGDAVRAFGTDVRLGMAEREEELRATLFDEPIRDPQP